MSIGNKHASYYQYCKPPPQRKKTTEGFRMQNATAEEIFQTQKINIKSLENKVAELGKQIKELKLENKNLCKTNILQEKELKKTSESSCGISSLMRSYKEEIRAIQSKASTLQDQLRITENNLKTQEKSVARKNQQIEKLTTAKRQNERLIKELTLENKELKSEKEKVVNESKELLELNNEFKLKNEELQQIVELMECKVSTLKDSLESAENNKSQMEENLNKLQKSYNELEQNFSLPKSCPTLVVAETQTDCITSKINSCSASDGASKGFFKKSEVSNDELKANDNYWVDGENIKIQEENSILSSDNICKDKYSELCAYQNQVLSNLPSPKIQKCLLKPIKLRTPHAIKPKNNGTGFHPVHSSYSSYSPFASNSNLLRSSNFLQSNYSTKNAKAVKCFSQKMF
ncbi:lebercilin isoform X2 [Parasteatoda tepidariorum]|nr:putative leucine-rich repeat-containing protein DDB_G0290503 isoform X2 [Parasteatoda tepidariorum]XP_020999991.2 putative leucine-rich repeat-containing protein DDB_G0290503 isoform X2 [Parasteatoda tepidariorum]XP_020999992.2 putative leucine-rich repeat-containing protein DDB_G0290503 isoform X2 [Parasteatoda tepidariorum]XP_042913828.1 putative leucine-rich repeat-containing protein DDB_G0290503 isoform X2 [Parasteatoda tepidariorum]